MTQTQITVAPAVRETPKKVFMAPENWLILQNGFGWKKCLKVNQ